MDTENARINMVKQQLRTWDVLNVHVLKLSTDTPRELFVPTEYQALAFADTAIPIGHNQFMLTPALEAKILQALTLTKDDHILEIGTGSGYMTALLANAGQHVYSIDIVTEFTKNTRSKLAKLGIHNVTLETGNGAVGWPKHQPYDVIVLTGGLPFLPNEFLKELKIGGRLFAVIGKAPAMQGVLVTRVSENDWTRKRLFETVVPYLLQTASKEEFTF